MKNIIEIKCKGNTSVKIDKLLPLQGELKALSDENYEKLKAAIVKHGFSFPELVWKDSLRGNAKYWIVDGHQRVKTVLRMIEEGWILPGNNLPVSFTEAKNKKEAYEKILLAVSQYGKYTEESMVEFMQITKINFQKVEHQIDFPQINIKEMKSKWFQDVETVEFPELKTEDREPFQQITFIVHDSQADLIKKALKKAKKKGEKYKTINANYNGNALSVVCEEYLER